MANEERILEAQKELRRIFGEETVTVGPWPDSTEKQARTKNGKPRLYFLLDITMDPPTSFLPVSGNVEEKDDDRRGIQAQPLNSAERLAGELMERFCLEEVLLDTNALKATVGIPVKVLAEKSEIKRLEKLTPLSFPAIQYLQIPTREFFERHAGNLRELREKTGEYWTFKRDQDNAKGGFYQLYLPHSKQVTDILKFMGEAGAESGIFSKKIQDTEQKLIIAADWYENSDLRDVRSKANFRKMVQLD